MALATKFRVQGTSDVFGQITVNIQLNDYVGSIIDLDGVGRDWIRLKIGDNSSEMSSPILAGKLTFSFYVTDDFQTTEIGKSEVYTYYVEVLDENLDQIWAGWAMPEEYTEAYHNTPYVATVVASDGLQELKNVSYPLQDGKATLFTHLQNCLISTFVNNNIFESVNIYSNGMNSTASDSPFKQAQVTYNSFRSISETPKAYEVLSSLLVPFFARIYQYRGWRIENILEKRSSYVVREYDITGTFVGQSTFNPLVKFDTNYGTFKAFIQKSGQLSIRPALNNAEVYFNTVEPVEPTTTGGFQDADDWVSTTELDKWTVVAGGGANQISIEQVPSSFDGNEFAVKIPGRKTSLELTDYIESDPVNIATADYESINVDFAHYANYPSVVLLGSKPILYFEIVFTETSSGDVYNWNGSEWVLIPLGQPRKRLRIDFNDRMKWRRYSAVIDRVPSTGNIKFRFYKLIKSGTAGVTELRLTAWKTNLIVSQPTNAALLLEAGTTNVFTQYKGPSFPHIISDGTVLNAAGVMDVANTLTATWARRGVTESLNIRRLFLTQWLSFNSRPTEILSGVIHQKGEVITPMSVIKDKDAVSSTRYVMQSYEISLGTGIGSASYREIVMEDANINAFQEFLDSIRLGDFFAATVNYNIFIGGAPGLSPGANPGQIDLNFNLNGDVRGGLNQAEITPAAIQNKARLDTTGLTADDIVLGAVKDSPDQENMTNLRLSDIKPLITPGVGAGLSLDSLNRIQIGKEPYPEGRVIDLSEWGVGGNSDFVITNSIANGDDESFFNVWRYPSQNGFLYYTYKSDYSSRIFMDSTKSGSNESASFRFSVLSPVGDLGLFMRNSNISDSIGEAYAYFIDSRNSKGLQYFDDYSAVGTLDPRWIPDWGAVTGAIASAGHNPVTIGSPANGLSIDGSQVLTIGLASTSTTGALSSTDWNTFNGKENAITAGTTAQYWRGDKTFQDFATAVRASVLTGYTVGANTALAATDTILQAFGKVQGQINARISGTIASAQVAVGNGVNSVSGSSNLTFTGQILIQDHPTDSRYILRVNGTNIGQFQALSDRFRFSSIGSTSLVFATAGTDWWTVNTGGYLVSSDPNIRLGIGNITPTNTLDVNGTARIRTISNLGSAATSVLVPSATGVVSLRTLAEFASDAGLTNFWTLSGSFIFRNSSVVIGSTTLSQPLYKLNTIGNLFVKGDGLAANLLIEASSTSGSEVLLRGTDSTGVIKINVNNSRTDISTSSIFFNATLLTISSTTTSDVTGFIDFRDSANTRKFVIRNGSTDYSDSVNINFGTTTGTRIATATNQKLAFWNATPIVRPSGDILTALSNLGLISSPTITQVDQFAVKTTASADQTLPSGTLTILDYDTTLLNNSTATYTVGTTGRITINTTGIYTITAGVVIEADAVTALESAFLGIFRNGNLVAISSINTTIAAGAQSGLSTSTILSLTATDIIDCRALVNSVGGVANGLARRLGTLLGANATQVNSLSITKNSM